MWGAIASFAIPALVGAIAGKSKAKKAKAEHDRQQRLAAGLARWSPYTGNQSWAQIAARPRPSSTQGVLQGALQGLQLGQSIQGMRQQHALAATRQKMADTQLQRMQETLANAQGAGLNRATASGQMNQTNPLAVLDMLNRGGRK